MIAVKIGQGSVQIQELPNLGTIPALPQGIRFALSPETCQVVCFDEGQQTQKGPRCLDPSHLFNKTRVVKKSGGWYCSKSTAGGGICRSQPTASEKSCRWLVKICCVLQQYRMSGKLGLFHVLETPDKVTQRAQRKTLFRNVGDKNRVNFSTMNKEYSSSTVVT